MVPREAYEKACEKSVTGLFQSEMERLKFPGLTITLVAINGLHVAKVIMLPVKSEYVPGVGVKVGFSAKLKILGTCWSVLLSGLTTINVHVDCNALVLLPKYLPLTSSVVVKDCQCAVVLNDISINLLDIRASVTASLGSNIVLALQVKTPVILSACMSFGHSKILSDMNCVLPLEKGKLLYVAQTPKVNDRFIEIPIQTEYLADNGKKIPILPLPEDFVVSPELNSTSLAIGENVITSILSYIVFKKPHSFSCTPQTFIDTLSLELIVSELIVSKCPACTPISSSLLIVTKLVKPLKVGLDVNRCAMNLSVRLEIMDKKGTKKPLLLIALKAELALTATLQLVEGKVQFTAFLDRLHFKLLSSIVGPVDIARLHKPLRSFTRKIILKEINFYLHLGKIPISSAPGLKPSIAHCHPSKRCLVCHNKGKKG
ncbi:BPI fold-containing family B member 3-like [Emydura macquarii macquarii]|uniref:BPI fold-containing family B member 3-like n=1 Tax=Emydura macquarii macquarii TaxID=1129001 RepID=UPI00352A9A3E